MNGKQKTHKSFFRHRASRVLAWGVFLNLWYLNGLIRSAIKQMSLINSVVSLMMYITNIIALVMYFAHPCHEKTRNVKDSRKNVIWIYIFHLSLRSKILLLKKCSSCWRRVRKFVLFKWSTSASQTVSDKLNNENRNFICRQSP